MFCHASQSPSRHHKVLPSSTVCPSTESTRYNLGKPQYPGTGSPTDPYVVDWQADDPENPLLFSRPKKWVIISQLAFCTWTISFASSVYSSGLISMARDLKISNNVAIMGISLYVGGFAVGPLIFAPMGEIYGRRLVFFITLAAYTAFQLEGCLAQTNIYALLSCRLLTGIFGSSPLTNSPSQIADIWSPRERGLASAVYSIMPFLEPIIGPIVGGLTSWRLNFWLMFICAALSLISGVLTPETYAPVLLRWRANKLTQQSNDIVKYISIYDADRRDSASQLYMHFSRPFIFLFTEPIVSCAAVYISVVYGTLYALFAALPIVFVDNHHFTMYAFTGIGIGILLGLASTSIQNAVYRRAIDKSETGCAPPEARLQQAMFGSGLVPVGLLLFARTASSTNWLVPVAGCTLFGIGISQILQSLTTYLMDVYPLYLASAVASTVVLRSIFAAFLPQLVPIMFSRLGDETAMSVFGVVPLGMPIPFLLWRYGRAMRARSSVAHK
ncbi:MFS general substrate transporter [Mycena amicta]|nr:MFS general substrate transporter [Mycena amicta]